LNHNPRGAGRIRNTRIEYRVSTSRNKPPERILAIRNDGIGDLVLTMPALAAVRRHFPKSHLAALVSPATAPLMAACREIDEVLIDDPADGPAQLGRRLRAARFDAALLFNTHTRVALAAWRAGIRHRVAWAYKPAGCLLANRRVAVHRSHPPLHESVFALKFVERLLAATGAVPRLRIADFAPKLDIDAPLREHVRARIARDLGTNGPLFGVHPGNHQSAYNWPTTRYAQLVARLAEHGRVIVTGGANERPLLFSLGERLPPKTCGRVAFYHDFSLLELVAAIECMTALTASSTGPMHLAGLMRTPIVALFSPNPVHSPRKWAPLGNRHTLLVAPLAPGEDPAVPRQRGAEVMARIEIDQVLDANLLYAGQTPLAAARDQAA
jgi:heptosyltransferase III